MKAVTSPATTTMAGPEITSHTWPCFHQGAGWPAGSRCVMVVSSAGHQEHRLLAHARVAGGGVDVEVDGVRAGTRAAVGDLQAHRHPARFGRAHLDLRLAGDTQAV